jgi:simple sugar transport system permease protein
MTAPTTTPTSEAPPPEAEDDAPTIVEDAPSRWQPAARASGRFLAALGIASAIFAVFMIIKGVNPISAYGEMISSTFATPKSMGEILIRATPIIFAALAVAVPARAGLVNVGGEGQLVMGGVAAAGVSILFDGRLSGPLTLVIMIIAAAVAGAVWAGIAALLRSWVNINEAVTTLLLNYIALDVMLFLIYDPWKDQAGSGQPATPPLRVGERLSVIGTSRVHIGIIFALIATVALWFVLKRTTWGFRLRVTGGNPEAARRAGIRVGAVLLSAMLVGGALAGLGGLTQLAGTEFKLRPGFLVTYGYLGFLASWLARHKPIGAAGAALLLSAIAIGGDSLQIDSDLPAASVNILIALVLLAMFGLRKKAVTA